MWYVGNLGSGFIVKSARGLTIGDVQYPRNIFTKWSKEELKAIGILPYRVESIDQKYYWQGEYSLALVDGIVVGTYTSIDRDVDQLKEGMVSRVRDMASSKLTGTDWMVIRATEGGTAVDAEVSTYRAAIRTESGVKETEIAALVTIDDVKAYENHPVVITTKTKFTDDNGVETYDVPLIVLDSTQSKVTNYGWSVDPLAKVDPSFVSIV